MKFDDSLWKALLEDLFADFLRFFFSNADTIFDMKKGFVYLDKEMAQIAADGDLESPRFVDKLVKVFTREGNEKWVLVHVEVQGYKDKQFEYRMFTYYYRIFDRYRQKITAVVLLTDKDKKFHPREYYSEFLGTELRYRFNSFKIIEQEEDKLLQSSNPFAFVVLIVLLALQRNRLTDKALFDLKLELMRKLLEQKFSKPTIKGIFLFIRNYVVFADPQNSVKFDEVIDSANQKNKSMGIVELMKERETHRLIEKGAEQKSYEFVKKLLAAKKFTIAEIADFAGVTETFVKKVKAGNKG